VWERIEAFFERLGEAGSGRVDTVGVGPFLFVLLISLAAALFLSFLYLRFYSGRSTGSQIHRAFPLLGLAVTAIFICIQFSLPLSLGLLGALSIVRFRTPIKEPEEIGFIMVLIAAALAAATFNLRFLVIILAVSLLALVIRHILPAFVSGPSGDGSLVLSVDSEEYAQRRSELLRLLDSRLRRARVESVSRTDGQVVLTVSFRARRAAGLAELEAELAALVKSNQLTVLYNSPTPF
jgi:hypothetical protein